MLRSRRVSVRSSSTRCFVVIAAILALAASPPLTAQLSFVQNPSFELSYNDVFPHYGDIASWTSVGGGGVNQADGPFHNVGTPVPDRDRVAFKQGSGSLAQTIVGLTPGETYWFQFFYDARACCGGSLDIGVKWNGATVDSIPAVVPATGGAPYFFRSVPFTPDTDTGTMTLEITTAGDATAVFDAMSVVQRDVGNVVIANPSFEASGPPTADIAFPPAVHSGELFTEPPEQAPANLAGWTATGTYGISLAGGTYADNGSIPDQDLVGVLKGPGASFSQTVSSLVAGTKYDLSFAYNAQGGTSPRILVKIDDLDGETILLEEDVAPVGGANPYRTKTVTFNAAEATAKITFSQTKETDETLLLDDIRLVGQVVPDYPLALSPAASEIAPFQRVTVQVTVPSDYLAGQAVDLQLSMDRPDRAQIVDADVNGILTLSFAQGGNNVQSFEIEAVSIGRASIGILNLDQYPHLLWTQSVSVEVVNSFVRNASFEGSPAPAPLGYGPILAWTGGSGVNVAGGPFIDNGIIPDRGQVAFLQQAQTLSQEIVGLTPGKNYWLQFRYNARAFGGTTIDLSVRFAGTELEKIEGIAAVGVALGDVPFRFASLQFSPTASSGLLEFVTSVAAGVDATLLLDAVSIVQRDPGEVVIENPSFEASGSPSGVGYVDGALIAGWVTGVTGKGINIGSQPFGPFSDSGTAPDQDRVLFIQGNGRFSQLVTGLTAGEEYTLSYSVNRRICCPDGALNPPVVLHSVTFADVPLVTDEEVLPVGAPGGLEPYTQKSVTFEALDVQGELAITVAVVAADGTFLIDDVHIRPSTVVPTEICDNKADDDGDQKIDCADEDCAQAANCKANQFVRGDSNSDGGINITDGIYVLNFLFLGGPAPPCSDAADTNNDGGLNITDGVYVLNFLFQGGPNPPPPHPDCGVDPEGDVDGVLCETADPNC